VKYCSNCANSLDFRLPEGDHLPRFMCDQCGMIHYQNPRVIVGCLCTWEDKVLLCKRAIEPRSGYWNIPAGFMENGETIENGAMREAYEEAGVNCDLIGLHSVFTIPRVNQVHVHFLTRMTSPDFFTTPESSEVVLFDEEDIPWEELAFASSVFSLKKYFDDRRQGYHQPHLGNFDPVVFSAWLQ
jgi:ADP-ribose pyrophosphatase YjhB (NUDIX family)